MYAEDNQKEEGRWNYEAKNIIDKAQIVALLLASYRMQTELKKVV